MKRTIKNKLIIATIGLLLTIASVFVTGGLTSSIAAIIISVGKFLTSNFFLAGLIYLVIVIIAELLIKNIFQRKLTQKAEK